MELTEPATIATDDDAPAAGPRPAPPEGTIVLRTPAHTAHLPTLRLVATSAAAHCDMGVDQIEDVRLIIDELATLLLRRTAPDRDLEARFTPVQDGLRIEVLADTTGEVPSPAAGHGSGLDELAWAFLQALTVGAQLTRIDGAGGDGAALTSISATVPAGGAR